MIAAIQSLRRCVLKAMILAVLAAAALNAPTATGHWVVNGDVDAKPFVLHCDFTQTGETLAGTCHDYTPDGKAHRITSGWVKDGKVRFIYQSNYLLLKFDAIYEGVLKDDAMSGTAQAAGRKGTFTARRG